MGGSGRPTRPGSRVASADGRRGAKARRGGLQRRGRRRKVAETARTMAQAERGGVTDTGSTFTEIIAGGIRWQIRPEWRDLLLGPAGLRLDEWLEAGDARIVKHGPHRTVYCVTLPGL